MDENKSIEEKKESDLIRHLEKEAINGLFSSVVELLPLIFTLIFTYINYLIGKKLIPFLEDFNNRSKKNILSFSPEQERLIKRYLRMMRDESRYHNISLWKLDNPSIDKKGLINADSFSLWLEASSDREIFDSAFLSFGFISEALNMMMQNNLIILKCHNISEGPICQMWLKKRGTNGYFLYRGSKFTFILLEIRELNLFTQLSDIFARKAKDECLDYCIKIDEIIQDLES